MRHKPENRPYRIQTQEHLDQLTEFWAEKLGLHGWDIRTALVPALGENLGECHFVYSQKRAHVLLVDFDAYDSRPDKLYEYDQEATLVHELLHPIMAPFTSNEVDSIEDVMLECIIEQMARALVATKRHYDGSNIQAHVHCDANHFMEAIAKRQGTIKHILNVGGNE